MLGLVQRWGEVFPRWMVGLAGRRVPMGLAVIPASLASVLLAVGGIGIWSGLGQIVVNGDAAGAKGNGNLLGDILPGGTHPSVSVMGRGTGGSDVGLLFPAAWRVQCVWSRYIRVDRCIHQRIGKTNH